MIQGRVEWSRGEWSELGVVEWFRGESFGSIGRNKPPYFRPVKTVSHITYTVLAEDVKHYTHTIVTIPWLRHRIYRRRSRLYSLSDCVIMWTSPHHDNPVIHTFLIGSLALTGWTNYSVQKYLKVKVSLGTKMQNSLFAHILYKNEMNQFMSNKWSPAHSTHRLSWNTFHQRTGCIVAKRAS